MITSAIDWRDRITIIGQVTVSGIIVIGFITLCVMCFVAEVTPAMQRTADTLFGAVIAAFSAVVGFWVGSSSGAQKNVATIAAQATAATAAAVAAGTGTGTGTAR